MNTDKKLKFLLSMAVMPDEAFGWIVSQAMQGRPFPDGLGGFQSDSRAAIKAYVKAAKDCFPPQEAP